MKDLALILIVLAIMAYAQNQQYNDEQRREDSYRAAMGRVK